MVFVGLLILISFNALYVAAEFAAVSVRRSRIHQQAQAGSRLAQRFLPFVEDGRELDRYVATCQIGITISSLVLGAFGQAALSPMIAPLFATWGEMDELAAMSTAVVTVLILLTSVQMILGELVPKSLALQYPTKIALYTVLPLQGSIWLLTWFIKFLNGSGLLILRVLGAEQTGHVHIHSAGEIEYLIAESREGGLLDAAEHGRLREALRLGITPVVEVMVPRTEIVGIPQEASPQEALEIAFDSPYSRFPVYESTMDEIVGYIHVQDLVRVALDEHAQLQVRKTMVIPSSTNLEKTLQQLRAQRHHMAIVVDEYGGTAGLITVGDILEDIFGGIADEFKPAEPPPQKLDNGRRRVSGGLRLVEATEFLGVNWAGSSITIGGFVMEQLGRIPEVGDELLIDGVTVTVEEMEGRRVTSLIVDIPQPPETVEGGDVE